MQDFDAGPDPGSLASRADGRSNLQIRFVGLWPADEAMYHNWMVLTAGLCCAKGDCCNERMALQGGARTKLVCWQLSTAPEQLLAEKKILKKR